MRVSLRALGVLALGAILAGCPGTGAGGDTAAGSFGDGDTLFARLGGMDGVRALVDDLTGRLAADERIQRFFVKTDFRRFKGRLVVQLCALTGGPCRYGGSMADIHRGRAINQQHFDAFMEDFAAALTVVRLSARDRVELLKLFRQMKPDIAP